MGDVYYYLSWVATSKTLPEEKRFGCYVLKNEHPLEFARTNNNAAKHDHRYPNESWIVLWWAEIDGLEYERYREELE